MEIYWRNIFVSIFLRIFFSVYFLFVKLWATNIKIIDKWYINRYIFFFGELVVKSFSEIVLISRWPKKITSIKLLNDVDCSVYPYASITSFQILPYKTYTLTKVNRLSLWFMYFLLNLKSNSYASLFMITGYLGL
jgi:hypothetical protein